MLTDDEIRALRDGCEGVTKGPWEPLTNADHALAIKRNKDGALGTGIVAKLIGAVDLIGGEPCICIDEPDRAHIARCDPQTISELCTRVLAAEARIKVLESVLAQYPNEEHAAVLEAGK